MTTSRSSRSRAGPADPLAWYGVLGGAAAWVAHLLASYALVPWVCDGGSEAALHVVTAATALVAAGATAAAVRSYRRSARAGAGSGRSIGTGPVGDPGGVHALLSLFGAVVSGFFLLLILAEGLPALLAAEPCAGVPTRDRPIIEGPARTPALATWVPLPSMFAWHAGHLVGPGEWFGAWNLDVWFLGGAALLAACHARGVSRLWRHAGRGRGIEPWRRAAYFGGILVLLLALVSPIDALGETLFSVHMVQHMLLMVVAPPLIVFGRPGFAFLWALPVRWRRALAARWPRRRWWRTLRRVLGNPVAVFALHAGALWLWHVPALYEAALAHRGLHLLEHASFLSTALLFWSALTRAGSARRWHGYGAAVLYVFATALQSAGLGGLLLFAQRPWYSAHVDGARLWGLELLVDQQLAGALMWVPAGLVYAGAMLVLFLAWLGSAERAAARRERQGWGAAFSGREPGHVDSVATTRRRPAEAPTAAE